VVYGAVMINDVPAPAGTHVEVVTPRGDVAGCFIVAKAGQYGFMHVYGEDKGDPPLPGFRADDSLRFRVNGADAVASSAMTWQDNDNPTPHRVDLNAALPWQQYLPFIISRLNPGPGGL